MGLFDRFAKPYHFLTKLSGAPFRHYRIIEKLSFPTVQSTVLDVGGGTGIIAGYFAEHVKKVAVLDTSVEMLMQADSKRIERVEGSAESIPFPDRTFDIVYSVDAMHHFPNYSAHEDSQSLLSKAAAEMVRVARRGGKIIILEIDRESILGKIVEYAENRIFKLGSHFLAADELARLFKGTGTRTEVHRRGGMLIAEISKLSHG